MKDIDKKIKTEMEQLEKLWSDDSGKYSREERAKAANKYNIIAEIAGKNEHMLVPPIKSVPYGKPKANRSRSYKQYNAGGLLQNDEERMGYSEGEAVVDPVQESVNNLIGLGVTEPEIIIVKNNTMSSPQVRKIINRVEKESEGEPGAIFNEFNTVAKQEEEKVRTPKAEGGSLLADDMMMVEEEQETHMMLDGTEMPGAEHEETMESDSEMEEGYLDFIIGEALSPEEEEMLMSKMEQDEELSMLFDKVIDVAQEFAGNGPVEGPGTGVSDSIPARLSDGEFVFTAKAVEEIGEDTLMSMMNEAEAAVDERQGFAEGTLVEEKPQALLSQTGIVQEDETVKGITEDMRKEVTRNIYS